jgi:hypothetical protein
MRTLFGLKEPVFDWSMRCGWLITASSLRFKVEKQNHENLPVMVFLGPPEESTALAVSFVFDSAGSYFLCDESRAG